jgi:hypothetical protein
MKLRNADFGLRPEPCWVQGCPAPNAVQGGLRIVSDGIPTAGAHCCAPVYLAGIPISLDP